MTLVIADNYDNQIVLRHNVVTRRVVRSIMAQEVKHTDTDDTDVF